MDADDQLQIPAGETLAGGPCRDPLRCRFWRRHPNGPWTCEFNHPRRPQRLEEVADDDDD